ncbi:hypothetical protein ACJX0J_033770, partial [Zea mays]
ARTPAGRVVLGFHGTKYPCFPAKEHLKLYPVGTGKEFEGWFLILTLLTQYNSFVDAVMGEVEDPKDNNALTQIVHGHKKFTQQMTNKEGESLRKRIYAKMQEMHGMVTLKNENLALMWKNKKKKGIMFECLNSTKSHDCNKTQSQSYPRKATGRHYAIGTCAEGCIAKGYGTDELMSSVAYYMSTIFWHAYNPHYFTRNVPSPEEKTIRGEKIAAQKTLQS